MRWLNCALFTLIIFFTPSHVFAQEVGGIENAKIEILAPADWKVTQLIDDARVTTFLITGLGSELELHVFKLDAEGLDPGGKAHGEKMLRGFLNVEKTMDFDAKGRARMKLSGCMANSYQYKDGDMETHIVGCLNPQESRYYIWRLAMAADLEDKDGTIKRFHNLLFNQVKTLDDSGAANPFGEAVIPANTPAPTTAPAPSPAVQKTP